MKEKGRISTVNNISWDNIHTLENKGIITTKADLELTNIPKIIQDGVLGSENNVKISGMSLTELTSDMYSDKKVIFGKTVTIECKLVQGIKLSAIGAVTITAKDTLNVTFVESGGAISLTAAQKIEASKLKAKGKIIFSAAKLIFLGLEIKSDGDISIPAGGELRFGGSSKLSSKGTLVIKRRLRPNNSNAEISAHTVEWHLAGLTQQEQDEFLNGGGITSRCNSCV